MAPTENQLIAKMNALKLFPLSNFLLIDPKRWKNIRINMTADGLRIKMSQRPGGISGYYPELTYDVIRKPYDPYIADFYSIEQLEIEIVDGTPRDCLPAYANSIIEFDTIENIFEENPASVFINRFTGRCFQVEEVVAFWRANLLTYDGNTRRILPQYPKDIWTGEYLHPDEIIAVALRAGIDVSAKTEDPIGWLARDRAFLMDVYTFHHAYFCMIKLYAQIPEAIKKLDTDLSGRSIEYKIPDMYRRRDSMALMWLDQIYEKNKLHNWAGRKYSNIPSTEEYQVFDSFLITSKLIMRFRFKRTDHKTGTWVANSNILIDTLVRRGYTAYVV